MSEVASQRSTSHSAAGGTPFFIRALHFDLKGVAPKADRYPTLLPLAAAAGYNALLVEWEGMFPWRVDERFRFRHAYSDAEVKEILSIARDNGMQVIPLVQCFGHMETPLSVADYAPLRHVPNRANVLNPLAPGARQLVERMIDDVLALCGPLNYFHLGGDEAFSFGRTDADRAYIAAHGRAALYLQHVEPLLDNLLGAGVRPILWHDMMAEWQTESLRLLAKKTDLMVWGYSTDPAHATGHYRTEVIERFHSAGFRMWAACAYKGADGPSADLPTVEARCANARGWVNVGERFGFIAAASAAWSRYTTHRVQSETIDGSLDSMVATGLILRDGLSTEDARAQAAAILKQSPMGEQFAALQAALAVMQDQRDRAWRMLRETREHLALAARDPFRRGSAIGTECLKDAIWHIDNAMKAAAEAKELLRGAISDSELDEYFYERFEPLHHQIPALVSEIAEQEPQTWAAAVKHLAAVDAIDVNSRYPVSLA